MTELEQIKEESKKYNVDKLTEEKGKKEEKKQQHQDQINRYEKAIEPKKNEIKDMIKNKIAEICKGLKSDKKNEIENKIKILEETINNNEFKKQEKIDEFLNENKDLILKESGLGKKLKSLADEINSD